MLKKIQLLSKVMSSYCSNALCSNRATGGSSLCEGCAWMVTHADFGTDLDKRDDTDNEASEYETLDDEVSTFIDDIEEQVVELFKDSRLFCTKISMEHRKPNASYVGKNWKITVRGLNGKEWVLTMGTTKYDE